MGASFYQSSDSPPPSCSALTPMRLQTKPSFEPEDCFPPAHGAEPIRPGAYSFPEVSDYSGFFGRAGIGFKW